jgi:hypothetical protein
VLKLKNKLLLNLCRFHASHLTPELCVIAKHKIKEDDKETSAKRDNNQHDDVIFWLNAPLGRERGVQNWVKEEVWKGRNFTLVIPII